MKKLIIILIIVLILILVGIGSWWYYQNRNYNEKWNNLLTNVESLKVSFQNTNACFERVANSLKPFSTVEEEIKVRTEMDENIESCYLSQKEFSDYVSELSGRETFLKPEARKTLEQAKDKYREISDELREYCLSISEYGYCQADLLTYYSVASEVKPSAQEAYWENRLKQGQECNSKFWRVKEMTEQLTKDYSRAKDLIEKLKSQK